MVIQNYTEILTLNSAQNRFLKFLNSTFCRRSQTYNSITIYCPIHPSDCLPSPADFFFLLNLIIKQLIISRLEVLSCQCPRRERVPREEKNAYGFGAPETSRSFARGTVRNCRVRPSSGYIGQRPLCGLNANSSQNRCRRYVARSCKKKKKSTQSYTGCT